MKRMYNRTFKIFVAIVMTLSPPLALTSSVKAANPASGTCQNIQLPVAVGTGRPTDQRVTGTICTPHTFMDGPHEIDVLTPGGAYNSLYWDWPQNEALSFVDKTLGAGRATFNYDRIGTGHSSHPLSTTITVSGEAYVLHQIISWAHSQGYSQINLLGHSYGSMITLEEAGTYNDATRVIITGLLHIPNIGAGLPEAFASLYPAALDPEFIGQGLDLGYLTTRPGTRGQLFYSSSADPAVIAYDEAHKDIVSSAGVTTIPTTYGLLPPLNVSDRIAVPVYVIVGQLDAPFCTLPGALDCSNDATVLAAEKPYYASASSLSAAVVPDTGHDLTLHPSAGVSFGMIDNWIKTH